MGISDVSPCAKASLRGLRPRPKLFNSGRLLRVEVGLAIFGDHGCEDRDWGPVKRRGRLDCEIERI